MNKENKISIELHHTPGQRTTRIKLQDMKTYNSEEYVLNIDEIAEHVTKLRLMYPKNQLLEFML